MINQDQFMYINWEDESKNMYRVGILARIDDVYYLLTSKPKANSERDAYSHGYAGLPGFVQGQMYRSTNELFDFFVNRVVKTKMTSNDYMEELKKNGGRLFTDSFSVEEVPEKQKANCRDTLLRIVELEEENELAQKAQRAEMEVAE